MGAAGRVVPAFKSTHSLSLALSLTLQFIVYHSGATFRSEDQSLYTTFRLRGNGVSGPQCSPPDERVAGSRARGRQSSPRRAHIVSCTGERAVLPRPLATTIFPRPSAIPRPRPSAISRRTAYGSLYRIAEIHHDLTIHIYSASPMTIRSSLPHRWNMICLAILHSSNHISALSLPLILVYILADDDRLI